MHLGHDETHLPCEPRAQRSVLLGCEPARRSHQLASERLLIDLILAVVAITFGSLGWHYAGSKGLAGKGMAIAGLTMGIITAVIFAILLVTLGNL